ncbi:MAG: hypothetical protein JNG89_14140 [Planctomycetaceae bacterium]|nr:hypothetical protein [Planctomycetaceae bacterium]
MARHEENREDLFAEATALTTRFEFESWDESEVIVAGRRANGAWSIYFGAEPCYHFDPEGRLRRAFAFDYLYRTQGNTLARLKRVRSDDEVVLQRTDLGSTDLGYFMRRLRAKVYVLLYSLNNNSMECLRKFPEDAEIVPTLTEALERILAAWPTLASAIPTRRISYDVRVDRAGSPPDEDVL